MALEWEWREIPMHNEPLTITFSRQRDLADWSCPSVGSINLRSRRLALLAIRLIRWAERARLRLASFAGK